METVIVTAHESSIALWVFLVTLGIAVTIIVAVWRWAKKPENH